MDYAHGFFTAIDRELDQHAKDIRNGVFSLYRDLPWTTEHYRQLQPVIRYELDRLVQSVLEVFDNVGCDKVADAALGYQIMVIPKVEGDDERLDAGQAIDICHDNRDYAALWSEFLIGKHEAAHPHTRGNES